MSQKFNLNIQDYTKQELEDLFDLEYPYTQKEVDTKSSNLRKKLLKDASLDDGKKDEIIIFMESAKKHLSPTLTGSVLEPALHASPIIVNSDNIIIKPPHIEGSGILNPLQPDHTIDHAGDLITRTLNIDTLFRDNYYTTSASDFQITLPHPVKNVVEMSLVACELPQSIYAISSALGNNFFSVTWTKSGVANSANIVLADGNYLPCVPEGFPCERGIQHELDFQLNRAIPHGTGGQVQMNVDPRSGKILVAANAAFADITEVQLNFNADICGNTLFGEGAGDLQLKLGWLLGFRFGRYIGSTGYISEGLYDFRGPRYLYLAVNDFNNNHSENIVGVYNDSITRPENILARLSWLQYVHFATTNVPMDFVKNTRKYFGPVNIQKLHIQLSGPYGRILSLNNMDYSLALEFKCLYKV